MAGAHLQTVAALQLLLEVAPHPVVDLAQTRQNHQRTEQGMEQPKNIPSMNLLLNYTIDTS